MAKSTLNKDWTHTGYNVWSVIRTIDEARNRFNRSYGAIASRLEKLVDSTEPHHIEMLMEASKEIKKRKNQRAVEKQKSRRVLRRERKEAKKLAKLQKKMAKLQGEING